jgi:hypothetical protein
MTLLVTIAINIAVITVGFLILNRKIDRKLQPQRLLEHVQSEVEGIITELNQTTDRNIGLVEDRVERLQKVLETADRRIGVMKREVEKQESARDTYNNIVRRPGVQQSFARRAAAQGAVVHGGGEQSASGSASRGGTQNGTQRGSSGSGASGSSAREEAEPTREQPQSDYQRRRQQIIDLHRKGIASNIIATRVGSTVGEVELVISLEKQRG